MHSPSPTLAERSICDKVKRENTSLVSLASQVPLYQTKSLRRSALKFHFVCSGYIIGAKDFTKTDTRTSEEKLS